MKKKTEKFTFPQPRLVVLHPVAALRRPRSTAARPSGLRAPARPGNPAGIAGGAGRGAVLPCLTCAKVVARRQPWTWGRRTSRAACPACGTASAAPLSWVSAARSGGLCCVAAAGHAAFGRAPGRSAAPLKLQSCKAVCKRGNAPRGASAACCP